MEQFETSCRKAAHYPMNLVLPNTHAHRLKAYHDRLSKRETDLFREPSTANVDFLEYEHGMGLESKCVSTLSDIQDYLWRDCESDRTIPRCKFMFIISRNSRDKLKISREMMSYALTFDQVMPAFLDFLFPFGRSEHAKDFQYSGFRHESYIGDGYEALSLPELGRSGQELRMCYSLKSAETSNSVPEWPWSVRMTSVYHSFDINTGHSSWIIVKGSPLIKNRIHATTTEQHKSALGPQTVDEAFESALGIHLLISDWSAESWRWYINFLEEQFQTLTRRTLAAVVEPVVMGVSRNFVDMHSPSRQNTISSLSSSPTLATSEFSGFSPKKLQSRATLSSICTPFPLSPISEKCEEPNNSQPSDEPEFSFSDLQEIHHLEEKATEVQLTLKSNISVLEELREYYESMNSWEGWSPELFESSSQKNSQFFNQLKVIVKDHQMELCRAESFIKLLGDRKALLYSILQYRTVEASRLLAERAQNSTDNMEFMTRDMHQIAQRTQQETVSMRIITLVTLFFLPGTFISVCICLVAHLVPARLTNSYTIMSTDIVRWNNSSDAGQSKKTVQLGALELYLAITLPLMVVTFVAWYVVYWWVNRRGSLKSRSHAPENYYQA